MAESSGNSRSVTSIEISFISPIVDVPVAVADAVASVMNGINLVVGVIENDEAHDSFAPRGACARLFSIDLSSERASIFVCIKRNRN